MVDWPKITIVTPSYNQGDYIERCIQSVLDQNYPDLEYFIIDGKSTDKSLEVIKKYEDRISCWRSEHDKGQADAINKGLAKATGQIFNWLNADDYLEPGALLKVGDAHRKTPDSAAWIGSCRIVDINANVEKIVMPNGLERDHIGNNWNGMVFYQPACFMSLEKIRNAGGLNTGLHYCMDFELYLRLLEKDHFTIGEGIWANALKHPDAKTQKTLDQCYLEVIEIQKKLGFHAGAKNRFERRFGNGRLEYTMPADVLSQFKKYQLPSNCIAIPGSFYRRRNLCWVGNLDSQAKVDMVLHFIKKVFPAIIQRNPQIQLHLFGRGIRQFKHLLETNTVEIRGDIDQLKDTAEHYKLCVFPDYSYTDLNKEFGIVAASGIPIVSTPAGAKGYPVKDGRECFIAGNDLEFAEKCNHCLSDPPTWGRFSARLQLMMAEKEASPKNTSENFSILNNHNSGSQNRKKLILIQGGFPALSATFILDQMTGLIDRGYEIENWSTYNPNESEIHPAILKYHLLPTTKYLQLPDETLRSEPELWIQQFFRLNSLENLNDVDLFHVHYGSNFNLLEPLFRHLPDKFVLVSFHGYDASRYFIQNGDNCYQFLFDRADVITTPSFLMKNELVKRGCQPEKVHVHRNGVDLKSLKRPFVKDNPAAINLLTVARLVEKKGLEYSFKAVAASRYRKKIKHRIIGDGPLKSYLQAVAKHLGIENHVTFLGGQAINEVIKEMSNADIFLLNSVIAQDGDMEGIPVSLIQAQAMGLPVVSSYHAGIPELVVDGQTGFLTEEKNISQITARLDKLISDPQLRKTFSDNARRRIEAEFDIERLNDRLKDYFEIGLEGKNLIQKAEPDGTIRDLSQIKTKFKIPDFNQRIYTYQKYFEYAEIFSAKGATDISIIIVCEKYSDDLCMNLNILNNQRRHSFRLILVNNGSNDSRFVNLNNHVDVYIKLNQNTGAYFSRNVAALFANSPILLFLDDDGIPQTDLIEAHLNAFKNFDVIAVRGVCLPKTDNQLNHLARHYYLGDKPFPVYADIEGNTSYRAEAFFKAGGWDDEIVFGGGGVDLSRRLLDIEPDRRKQIYSPEPVIFHDFAADSHHLRNKQKKQEKSRLRLRKKHHDYDAFLRSWNPFFKRDDLIIRKKIEAETSTADPILQAESMSSSQNNIRSIDMTGIQNPKFSICIPTYNRAEFLKDSVRSVLDQNYRNCEIVIVDDGSTDHTATIAKSFNSDKIRYIAKDHENAAATRNRCIEAARGDYLVWLDDDDILAAGILGKYSNIIEKEPLTDVIYGRIKYFENTTGECIRVYNPADWGRNKQALLQALIKGCVIPNPGTLVRKSLYEKAGRYNIEFLRAHDYEFWTRAVEHANLKKIDELVAEYRVHDSNLSVGAFIDKSFESKIIRNMIQRYSIREIFADLRWEEFSKASAEANYIVAKSLVEYHDYVNARLFLESIPVKDLDDEMLEMSYRCELFSGDSDALGHTIQPQRSPQNLPEGAILKFKKFFDPYGQLIKTGRKQIIQSKYSEAGKTVKQSLETFGITFDSMLLAAELMTRTGKKTEALQFLRQAVICGPHNLKSIPPACLNSLSAEAQKELYQISARLISRSGFKTSSNQHTTLIEGGIDVENYEKMYQGIQPLLKSSKPEDAIAALKNLVDSFPDFAQGHNDLGVLYYSAGDKQTALRHYERAVQLEPGNITFKKNLADFYYVEQNRVEDALKLYVDVLAIQPEDVETLMITGHICIAVERFEDAEVFYKRVLEIEPWNAGANEMLEKLQNRGQEIAPALAAAKTAEEMYQEAQSLMQGNDPEAVIKALEDIVVADPDFALAHNDLGVLYYNTGNKDKALGHYEHAARLEDGNITFKKNLADFYFVEQNRVEDALQLYVDVLAIQPEDIETLLITGHICVSLHRFEDAKVFYNRVLEIEPWNADARQNLETLESKRQAV